MTKDIEREAFEKLPEVAEILNEEKSHFNGDFYNLPFNSCAESFINGAWYGFQEAKKLEGCVVVPVEMPDSFNDATTDYFNDISEGENYDAFVKLVDIDNKSIWAMAVEAARGGNE